MKQRVSKIPKWPFRVLRWFCKPWYVETIEGDLHELFDREVEEAPCKARWRLYLSVAGFFRLHYLKNLEDVYPQQSFGMLRNYVKVFLRNAFRNRIQSLLNVLGLAIGIACCLLMAMHVNFQLIVDQHVKDVDHIFYVANGRGGKYTPAQLVKYMQADFPEVVAGSRVQGLTDFIAEMDGNYLSLEGGMLADSSFFEVFETDFLLGEPADALNDPNELVLTEGIAEKLFPKANPIGELVRLDHQDYVVSAVVKDQPSTSTMPYQFIVTMPRDFFYTTGYWTGNNFFSYLRLAKNATPEALEAKFPHFVKRYLSAEILKYYDQYETYEDYLVAENGHFFSLIPMLDIHLYHSHLSLGKGGDQDRLIIFSVVAMFILAIACFNYINLSTARASLRAKEIGVRKVMGSLRQSIAKQFLVEALIITSIAVLVGLGISVLLLPYFNQVSGEMYVMGDLLNVQTLGYLLLITSVTGIVAGGYPAVYMSSLDPVSALKGERRAGNGGGVRVGLMIIQFAISLFLMIVTYIVYLQMDWMSHRKLGLDAEHVYVLRDTKQMATQYEVLKSEFLASSKIANVGLASDCPSSPFHSDWSYETIEEVSRTLNPLNVFVSSEIQDVWGLELIDGRFFDPNLVTDSMTVVINKELAVLLGWEDPVGRQLSRGNGKGFRIIGVVEDFAMGSAKVGSKPVVMRSFTPSLLADYGGDFMIKLSDDVRVGLNHIDEVWEKFSNGYPTEGFFMDDSFQQLYQSEKRFGLLFSGFSLVAIVIACIGLFSLASFMMERRKREIALRKVMGAQVLQIFGMIAFYFVKLVVIGAVLAIPVAYFLGERWLDDYVDRVSISPLMVLMPLILLLVIALVTTSFQTIKTASSNPIDSLKEE